MLRIAPAGWRYVGIGLAAAAILARLFAPLAVLGLLLAAFSLFFFRDPERPLPSDPDTVYSPGDGTVMTIRKEGPGEYTTMRMFLSVFNVHVQRAPVPGRVEKITYQPGAFHMAMKDEAVSNERNVITIDASGAKLILEQVAGWVARRIQCYVKAGDSVKQGERIGLIHFGSQLALHLPDGWEFAVKPGDRLVGAVSVVAGRKN